MYRHGKEEIEAAAKVLRTGQWFRFGDKKAGHQGATAKFEAEWAKLMGVPHSCFVTSGTAALMCAYAGLQIGPGDEVIIPGFTWIASPHALLALGAIPVIVDVDESLMLDPEAVERAITPRTKAIDPVHMSGFMCDLDRLQKIARQHNLYVVEDACQCVGGYWKDGRRAGAIGDAGAYSFNWYKVISCGDAGIFIAKKRDVYERGVIYHDGGTLFWPSGKGMRTPPFAGINFRGNEILAAIMRVQAARLNGIVRDLHRVRNGLRKRLAGAPGLVEIPENGARPAQRAGGSPSGGGTGTGANLGLRFENETAARAFAKAFRELPKPAKAGAWLPIDSGRHVYWNWESLLQRRGSYSQAADPFLHPANKDSQARYAKDMLPRTLEILKRTVLIPINPDWKAQQIDGVAQALREAAKAVP
ncbi:MAG: aminotransferase class I/II-fold pyridoxal phosphate-dependent enzyme [Planctomycetota bacterium]